MVQSQVNYGKKFETALVFATQLHHGHFRKGTNVPYVTHLLAVASLVGEAGGSEDEVIAALLHDAIEDCGGKPIEDQIRREFGDPVADIVVGCSDTDQMPKPPWKQRKEAYIAHLEEATASMLLVSCADKLHNARTLLADYRSLGDALWNRFNATRDQTLWYYRTVSEVFQRRGVTSRLVNDLERTVTELEQLVS